MRSRPIIAELSAVHLDELVIRDKPGNAVVHVTPPGGFERVLRFIDGKVSADGSGQVKAKKDVDLWLIDVNDYEHYRIPDVVITGG